MNHFYNRIIVLFLAVLAFSCSKESDDVTDPKSANRKTTGSSANDFLSNDEFNSLTIELIYVDGYKPNQTSINNLKGFIEERTYKTGNVSFVEKTISSPGITEYNVQKVADLEDDYREAYNFGDDLAMSILFLDGKSDQDEGNSVVLGTAYRNTSIVIFQSTIIESSNQSGEPDRVVLESTVLEHEFCHLLGLVNFGTPMQEDHQDEENGNHCDVESCLMNHQVVVGRSILGPASESAIPGLDAKCLADLQANGGK